MASVPAPTVDDAMPETPGHQLRAVWPGLQTIVYGLKVFGAAMLALYIALLLPLDRPFWAILTAFIVAQPLTGMAVAKGLYRFAGTLAGASWAVINLMLFAG